MRSIFLILVAFIFVFSGCNNQNNQTLDKEIISVSILPQKYFIEQLTADKFFVNVMLPPGTSPASYDPSPKKLRELNHSELYLKIGHLGFELVWMESFQKNHKELKVIDLSTGIELIRGEEEGNHEGEEPGHDHDHSGIDPHIWMSPKSAAILAQNTANAIISLDPASETLVNQKLAILLEKINKIDRDFETLSNQLENKKFIIFHPALTYLARDYGLEQIPMEFEGKKPSASHLKGLIDLAKAEDIHLVFIQKEFDQNNARQIAEDLDALLIQIDPLAEDWEAQMNELLEAFKN
jgi:zinc transport system substrate-binding protein